MRNISVDLSNDSKIAATKTFGSFQGEHNGTMLSVVLPEHMLPSATDLDVCYEFIFQTPIDELIRSTRILSSDIDGNIISVKLWGQLLEHEGNLTCCVAEISDSGETVELISKSPTFCLVIKDSTDGNEVLIDASENKDTIAQMIDDYLNSYISTSINTVKLYAEQAENAVTDMIIGASLDNSGNLLFTQKKGTQINVGKVKGKPGYSVSWSMGNAVIPTNLNEVSESKVEMTLSMAIKQGETLINNVTTTVNIEEHSTYTKPTVITIAPTSGYSMQWKITYPANAKIPPLSNITFTVGISNTEYTTSHILSIAAAKQGPTGSTGATGPQGPQGESGVYVGTSEPEDDEVTVWVNPAGTDMAPPVKALANVTDQLIVPLLIAQYGFREAFGMFAQANADYDDLTSVCNRFFEAAAKTESGTYTSRFHKFTSNSSTVGVKLDANAGLTCTPSTRAAAGTDDYAALPLFACFDVNYTIDADTLEPVILAVRDVYGSFSLTPADSLVGVMQMTGWVRRTSDDTTKTVEYRSTALPGFRPLPEAVRAVGNTVRSFVVHAKYAAGYNSAGRLSSVSGVQPATQRVGSAGSTAISHDGQIAKWREWGNQYCGSSLCDIAFLQLMLEIKYAVLGSAQVMQGCRSCPTNRQAAAAETGVTRVLLTAEQAASFVVGGSVSLGSTNDRSKATAYDVCDITKIASIEDVTVSGTAYKAINLDTETSFNTTTATYITTQPWQTGATDDVPGNDGSPTSNTSGKEPFKLQGIEIMLGVFESLADTTLYGDTQTYTVYLNRKASEIAPNASGTNPVTVGTVPKGAAMEWKHLSELNWDANDPEAYLLGKTFNAEATTGYRAGCYRDAAGTTGWREWQVFGHLTYGEDCGLVCSSLASGTSIAYWSFGARACGSGGNRGVYTPANS